MLCYKHSALSHRKHPPHLEKQLVKPLNYNFTYRCQMSRGAQELHCVSGLPGCSVTLDKLHFFSHICLSEQTLLGVLVCRKPSQHSSFSSEGSQIILFKTFILWSSLNQEFYKWCLLYFISAVYAIIFIILCLKIVYIYLIALCLYYWNFYDSNLLINMLIKSWYLKLS